MLPLRLLVYLVLVVSSSAFACVCHEVATPADWYAIHHGQPTFVGIVVSVDRVTDVVRQGGGKPLLDASGKTISTTVRKVTFRIEESFEDFKERKVEVYGFGTTCDYPFIVGVRYLVYGWVGEDHKIRTAKCTRTAPSSQADEDVNFLHALRMGKRTR